MNDEDDKVIAELRRVFGTEPWTALDGLALLGPDDLPFCVQYAIQRIGWPGEGRIRPAASFGRWLAARQDRIERLHRTRRGQLWRVRT